MTADGCMSMCQALSHPVLLQKTTEFKCWYQTLLSAALCVQSAEEHTAMYFRPYFSEPTEYHAGTYLPCTTPHDTADSDR